MKDSGILTATLLEDACLTLEQLARAAAVEPEWVLRHMQEGFLPTLPGTTAEWRFSSRDLWRVRQIHAVERDFDAVPELAALVADMLEELEALRLRLQRAGLD